MASFRVKQGVWSNPPASAFLQVKSYMYSILLPFLPHGTRPRGLSGYQVPLSAMLAQLPCGRTHLPGQPESHLGRKGENMSSGRTIWLPSPLHPLPGLVQS